MADGDRLGRGCDHHDIGRKERLDHLQVRISFGLSNGDVLLWIATLFRSLADTAFLTVITRTGTGKQRITVSNPRTHGPMLNPGGSRFELDG